MNKPGAFKHLFLITYCIIGGILLGFSGDIEPFWARISLVVLVFYVGINLARERF